jgi:radical SAM enzyme (TIGR01210 family)
MKALPTRPIYHGKRTFLGMKDLVVSFYTQRCPFGCSFCGLHSRSSPHPVDSKDIERQVDWLFDHYAGEIETFEQLSAGNEGSILDPKRFPIDAFDYLIQRANAVNSLKVLSLETRPEYITGARLKEIRRSSNADMIDVTVGFETQDDELRNGVLKKHLDRRQFEETIVLLGRLGVRLTSYVMLKPGPTMTEEEGVHEAVGTMRYLADTCGKASTELVIYLNPTYVAEHSPLARAMKETGYRPPKIQSVVRTIIEAMNLDVPIYTGLWCENIAESGNDFTGRKDYDKRFRAAVKVFNKTQDPSVFERLKLGPEPMTFSRDQS